MSEKAKAIETLVSQVEKQFGKGSLMKLGGRAKTSIPSIPTGALTLDIALGIGGVPRGRVIEIYGPESSGKTTLSLHIVANAQKAGGVCGFIDAEHALDPKYASMLGVDVDNLLVSQPSSGEEALEILDYMVRSGAMDLVIVDSVAALVPRSEIEGDMGDATMGAQARLMSQALRKLTASVSKSDTAVIFINQIRQKIGVMFGSPETTTGGNALKFYASVRMDIRRIDTLKKGTDPIGNRVRVKLAKNKVAPPFQIAEFDIYFNEGISREGCVLDLAVKDEVIKKNGTWYVYNEENIGQGKDNARLFLKDNPDILIKVENQIRKSRDLPEVNQKAPETPAQTDDESEAKKPRRTKKKTESGDKLPLDEDGK